MRCLCAGVFLAALFATAGCNNKGAQDALNTGMQQAAQVVERAVETAKQEANLVGSMELYTDPPLQAKACYATLIIVGEGRPNVLRLASYKTVEMERFPAMMLQAQVEAQSLHELSGRTVQAEMFAQSQADGPVWHSPAGSPASVTIAAVDDRSLTCQVSGASILNSDTGERSTVSGKFVALFE